jgi:hypothetical protein
MSTVQSVHLTLKAVRLLELCEAKGFEKIDDLLLASIDDSVCPAICMECGCTAQWSLISAPDAARIAVNPKS